MIITATLSVTLSVKVGLSVKNGDVLCIYQRGDLPRRVVTMGWGGSTIASRVPPKEGDRSGEGG